jgi:hypothetical protein
VIHAGRMLFLTSLVTLILVAAIHGQDQIGGPGGPQSGSVAGARGGQGFGAVPTPPSPKPIIPNAKPVRSCESLATVSLPNRIIESAAVDTNNSGICRVSAFTTHPPARSSCGCSWHPGSVIAAAAQGHRLPGNRKHCLNGWRKARHRRLCRQRAGMGPGPSHDHGRRADIHS